jgi:hypothetical protein
MPSTALSRGAQAVVTVSRNSQAQAKGMLRQIANSVLLALLAAACSHSPNAGIAGNAESVTRAFCELVRDGRTNDGRRIRVRAAFGSGAEHIRLFDQECPLNSVYIRSVRSDVDVTLCNSEKLSKQYGCPVSAESGVRATFVGSFHFESDTTGRLDVDEMLRISTEQ